MDAEPLSNNLTPAEIRQELIKALSEGHYTNAPDEKLLDDIMTYYPGTNWPGFFFFYFINSLCIETKNLNIRVTSSIPDQVEWPEMV